MYITAPLDYRLVYTDRPLVYQREAAQPGPPHREDFIFPPPSLAPYFPLTFSFLPGLYFYFSGISLFT